MLNLNKMVKPTSTINLLFGFRLSVFIQRFILISDFKKSHLECYGTKKSCFTRGFVFIDVTFVEFPTYSKMNHMQKYYKPYLYT